MVLSVLFFFASLVFDGRMESAPPQSGFAYYIQDYISPPRTLRAALVDPIPTHLFIATVWAIVSETWIEVSSSGPRDIAR